MLIEEAYKQGLLSDRMYEVVPKKCIYCGYDLEVSENLKQLWCPNDTCPAVLARKIENMFKEFGVDGFGPANCMALVQENNLTKVYQVFDLGIKNMPSRYTEEERTKLYNLIQSVRKQPLYKIIKALQLEGIQDTAKKLFGNYNSIEKFYEDLMDMQEKLIASQLGISIGDRVYQVYKTLLESVEDIFEMVSKFEVEQVSEKTLTIAITGAVNGYPSKEKFVEEMNKIFGHKVNILLSSTLTKSCDYLIAERASGSSKYNKAQRYNIPIVTSAEFINILESM